MELLDVVEVRVLGALIEKEATTPEYYPLSLNALVNACNQKSNRFPVVDYDESDVKNAVERLRAKRLALVVIGNGRVTKYSQSISQHLNMGRRELALLCTLLLRGPQTIGEIKDRSERIFSFADLEETERVLEKLAEWPSGPLAKRLPRQPGQKEARYGHLFSGEAELEAASSTQGQDGAMAAASPLGARMSGLETQLEELRQEVKSLKQRIEEFEALLR